MATINEQYYKKPEETIEQYYARTPTPDRPGEAITPASMTPEKPIEVQTPTSSVVDVSNLAMTPVQQQAQTQTEDLMSEIKKLSGETEYRTGIEQEKDITGLAKVQTEQATIVQNLQLEAKRLANQYAGVEDVMQAQAEGRGITTGGLAPLTASEQRKIAIQQRAVASQALTAYAAYNVAAGNLQVAQQAVDRAVAAKYDPIKADIDIKMKNLELLLGSPLATAQEKALAQTQLKKQEDEKKKVDEQEGYFKSLQDIYVQMAATPNISLATINAVRNLLNKKEITIEDVAEATRLAQESGMFAQEAEKLNTQVITTPEGRQLLINTQTGETIKDFGMAGVGGAGGVEEPSSISSYQTERMTRTLQSVNELLSKAVRSPGIFGATAAMPIPDFLRSDAFRNFESELDTLKSNIAFGELTAMREASKTGGALGQVSDKEGQLLQSALGALKMSQSPENFQKQLVKIKDSIIRWREAQAKYPNQNLQNIQGKTVIAPDGQEILITD